MFVGGLCVLVAGAMLVWLSRPSLKTETAPRVETRQVNLPPTDSQDNGDRPRGAPAGASAGTAAAGAEMELRVRAVDAESQHPVEGAVVRVGQVERMSSEGIEYWLAPDDASSPATATTGENGWTTLRVQSSWTGAHIAVSAQDRVPFEDFRFGEDLRGPIVVSLRAGFETVVKVQAPDGTPLSDFRVGHQAWRPRPRAARDGREAMAWKTSTSDERGLIRLKGMEACALRFRSGNGRWLISLQSMRDHSIPSDKPIVITMVPTLAYRIQLVHGEADAPIGISASISLADPTGRLHGPPSGVYFGGTRWDASPVGSAPLKVGWSEPGVFIGIASISSLPSEGGVPKRVAVIIQANGFHPCTAEVALRSPGELASSRVADRIRLAPIVEPHDTGGVRLLSERVLPSHVGFPRNTNMRLFLGKSETTWEREISGTLRDGQPGWMFEGVPSGRWIARFMDRYGTSGSVVLTIEAGATTDVLELAWPGQVSGATFVTVDPSGRFIPGIAIEIAPDTQGSDPSPAPRRLISTSVVSGSRKDASTGLAPAFLSLPAGEYRYVAVSVPGVYRRAQGSFTLREGEVRAVRIDLVDAK